VPMSAVIHWDRATAQKAGQGIAGP
jgi:hypothetical protein